MKVDVHPVDSKETMLSENDIVIVAAHNTDLKRYQGAAKKHGVTAERLAYMAFAQVLQNPALILVREGNTFFPIAALKDRIGYVYVFHADTKENSKDNLKVFLEAAYKMGFNRLYLKDFSGFIKQIPASAIGEFEGATFYKTKERDALSIVFDNPHKD